MRRIALVLCAATCLLEGCGFPSRHTSGISFPSPIYNVDPDQIAAAPVSARIPGSYSTNISGVVKAGGVAAAGATVVVVADGFIAWDSRTTVTDNNGRYTFADVNLRTPMGPLISAFKPGYFTDAKWSAFGDQAVDFDLSPVMYTQVGTVVRSRMPNALCAGLGYGGVPAPCHRVAIIAPATGTLEVTVSAPTLPGDLDIWGPKGASAAYFACPCASPFPMKLAVEKGETYEIRVTMTPEIELTAAVRVS